jgi:hypoxanthine-DNA glycosylase
VTTVHGFPPIARADAMTLVLGTMPGIASLQAGQYYAHGRNVFWKVMAASAGFDVSLPYEKRVECVVTAKIAVWDVLKLCTREGSLDSDIEDPVPNDLGAFFNKYEQIDRVCFNGGEAESLYKSHVLKSITKPLEYIRLPSTSPAYAAMSFTEKCVTWAAALRRQ